MSKDYRIKWSDKNIKLGNKIYEGDKQCNGCKKKLSKELFHRNKTTPDGLAYECKKCRKEKGKSERNKNIQKNKFIKLDLDNSKKCPQCKNIKKISEFGKSLSYDIPIHRICKVCSRENNKKWRNENPEKRRKYNQKPDIRILNNLRRRLHLAVSNQKAYKQDKTLILIGCSPKFLYKWIEYQFDKNMKWNNYGSYWDVDHVIGCANFDFSSKKEQLICFNWKNLQPLEKKENNSKNDKIDMNFIAKQAYKLYTFKRRHIQIAGTP